MKQNSSAQLQEPFIVIGAASTYSSYKALLQTTEFRGLARLEVST